MENAKLELEKSLRKNYYKVLGVGKQAGEDEIRNAYKRKALIHHPDKHSNATEEELREQEKKFKEIGEAYAILSDPIDRRNHDRDLAK